MQYTYSFEMAAVIIMLVIMIHFLLNRRFPIAKNYAFFALLCAATMESVTNIISCICLTYTDTVPQIVNEIIVYIFFLAQGITAVLLIRYVTVICEISLKDKQMAIVIGSVPFLFYMIMLLLNPIVHFFFYFKENHYYQGWGSTYGYVYIIFYIVYSLLMTFLAEDYIRKKTQIAVIFYGIVSFLAIMIQLFFREQLMTGFANAVILLMMYLTIQIPNELLDRVTGVANGTAFRICFRNNMMQEKEMSLFNVDLHQYSQIHTIFGYENGTVILREVGEFLLKEFGIFHVFHLTGDSFVCIAYNKQNPEELLEKIWKRFDNPWKMGSVEVMLRANVVQIDCPLHVKTDQEFIVLNNFLKLEIRENPLKNYLRANEELIKGYERNHKVEIALSNALENHTLQVYYQPVYNSEKKRITSLEALVRLQDDELGFIPPDEFINLAEHTGIIISLDLQVFEESCRFLEKHILPNDSLGIETIQINVSVVQCMQQNMADVLLAIMKKHHIPPERITLEITERAAVSTPALMARHMKRLAEKGITFALDDYGTGNSNCSYLINYPFDKVKFDKNMIWSYFTSETAKIILDNEMKTIHELNIPVVAEGVETMEQLEEMQRLGVEYIQGYYFARPMPADECLQFVRQMNCQ